MKCIYFFFFFFSSRRRHTRLVSDWSSDVCSSDLASSHGYRGQRRVGGSRRLAARAMQLHVEAIQGHEAPPDLGALERRAGLGAGLYLLDRTVEQLVDERVAHTLDVRLFLRREFHTLEGAGELVTANLLGPVAELLYERDDVQC